MPGIVQSDISLKANHPNFDAADSLELMANFAIWLASAESDFSKGHFLQAELGCRGAGNGEDRIRGAPMFLRLTLEYRSNGFAELYSDYPTSYVRGHFVI